MYPALAPVAEYMTAVPGVSNAVPVPLAKQIAPALAWSYVASAHAVAAPGRLHSSCASGEVQCTSAAFAVPAAVVEYFAPDPKDSDVGSAPVVAAGLAVYDTPGRGVHLSAQDTLRAVHGVVAPALAVSAILACVPLYPFPAECVAPVACCGAPAPAA